MKAFTCSCGTRTTAPFLINGQWMCTLCAEEVHPGMVSRRAAKDWNDFIAEKPKLKRPRIHPQYDRYN